MSGKEHWHNHGLVKSAEIVSLFTAATVAVRNRQISPSTFALVAIAAISRFGVARGNNERHWFDGDLRGAHATIFAPRPPRL
jgi:hypothetical protein